jgi:hypothetical protein
MSEVLVPFTLLSEILTSWKGRRSTRERLIVKVLEQHPQLSDELVAKYCGAPEELVRWLRGDVTGRPSIPKRHSPKPLGRPRKAVNPTLAA